MSKITKVLITFGKEKTVYIYYEDGTIKKVKPELADKEKSIVEYLIENNEIDKRDVGKISFKINRDEVAQIEEEYQINLMKNATKNNKVWNDILSSSVPNTTKIDYMEDIYSNGSLELPEEKEPWLDATDVDETIFTTDYEDSQYKSNDETNIDEIPEEQIDEISDNDEKQNKKHEKLSDKAKRNIAKITALTVAVVSVIGIGYAIKKHKSKSFSKSNTQTTYVDNSEYSSIGSIIDEYQLNNEQADFLETNYSVLNIANKRGLSKKVFALEKDGNVNLQFTSNELVAAKLILNDYSEDELESLFGGVELDSEDLYNDYISFSRKVTIYYMNAKKVSGISKLIENAGNRKLFEKIEKSIVEFNNNINRENSDRVIKNFAYLYRDKVSNVDGEEIDSHSVDYVKNLSIKLIQGYLNANSNYSEYTIVSTNPNSLDDKYETNKLNQIQKGEKLKTFFDMYDKKCPNETIEEHLKNTVDKINSIDEPQYELGSLVEKYETAEDETVRNTVKIKISRALSSIGEAELSSDILKDGLTDKTKEKLEICMNQLGVTYSFMDAKEGLDEIYPVDDNFDYITLFNNRVRGNEKSYVSSNVVVNNKTSNNKTTTKTTTKTEKVDKKDLTKEEKKQVEKKEQQIKKETHEVIIEDKSYKAEKADAAKKAWTDATSFAEEKGAYKHADIYNKVNPNAVTKVPTNGTLSNIAQVAYAFNNETITVSDPQIQSRLNRDINNYKKINSNSDVIAAYKSAWIEAINQKLSSARSMGKVLRDDANRLYQEQKKQVEEKNKSTTVPSTTKPQTTKPSSTEPTTKPQTTKPQTTKPQTTKPSSTEPTTKPQTTKPQTTKPQTTEDPNINPIIADSDEGYEDVYDENLDAYNKAKVYVKN